MNWHSPSSADIAGGKVDAALVPQAVILIVDDDIRSSKLLATLLQHEGYSTLRAASGEEALASVALHAPDLILLDILFPGMDGYQVAAKLKADPATSNIPIIMVTQRLDREAHMAGLKSGAEEILTKPVDRAELWLRVRNLLRLKTFGDFFRDHSSTLEKQVQTRTKSLLDSEARFRSLSMLSSDWFWEQDENHRFVRFSGGESIRGWGPDQNKAVGVHRWDLGGVIPLSSNWEEHKALLDAHKPFRKFEYQRILDDGRLQIVEASGEPVFDAAGRFTGYRGVATEITERKRAERELQRFRAAMDSSGDAIVLVDRESMRYIDVNQTLCDMVGYTRQELIGMTPMQLFGADRAILERDYDAIIADVNSSATMVEGHYRHRNGTSIPIETRRRALHTDHGWIIVGTARDISERKQGEEALQRISSAMDATADAIYMVDRSSMRFVHINDAACRMQGKPREELLALGPAGVLSVPRPELEAVYDAIIAGGGEAKPLEMQRRRANGSQVWVELRRHALSSSDGWTIVTLARDITERKASEERIRRLNRVHAVLSGINSLIVRARNRDELFKEACQVAVQAGHFTKAWLGLVEARPAQFRIVAAVGGDPGFFTRLAEGVGEKLLAGQGLVARALATRLPVISNDMASDPEVLLKGFPGQERMRSLAILPLIVAGEAVGVFALNADVPEFFDAEELKLLAELAGDIAHAIDHIDRAEKLERITRVNAMVSGINGAIARIRDRQSLFDEACRIAVETGGLTFAWLRVVDEAEGRLRQVASAGPDHGFLDMIRDRLSLRDDAPEGHGLSARCVREGRPLIANNIEASADIRHKRQYAERGIKSAAALPLIIAGRTVGVLLLNAAKVDFFDDAEMRLFSEIAGNIAFALEHIEKEAKVQRLTRVYAVLSRVNSAIVRIRERGELFAEICRIALAEGGFTVARVIELDPAGVATIAARSDADAPTFQLVVDEYNRNPGQSQSLLALALRNGEPLISNDVAIDTRIPDRARLAAQGTYALALLPIKVEERIAGVVSLRAREAGMFDAEELRLLLELVGNLSFALDLMEKRERLDHLAYYDALTGLANRKLLLERLSQYMRSAVAGGHRLALFLIDMERFRNINDSLGRTAGDALLKQVAEWLSRDVGEPTLLARLGSDHFAIILPEMKREGSVAHLLDKRIRAFAQHPFRLKDADFRIALKVGVALFPNDGVDADTLLRNAEAALKKAKRKGERYLFYKQKMNEAVAGKLTLENQLRRALDKGEFVLHYQPKMSLATGKVVGAEALIRWNDPDTGLVPPGLFIPVLEETGLINEVGRWALRQAIQDYLRWRSADLPAVRIAVNVSPLQLRNSDFVAEIERETAIDPRAAEGLELEITESLVMEDVKHGISSLRAIRALGVTIAIDDFGTGFSSLSHLSKLPVDTLKIDRSFVTDMTTGAQGLALVSTIISLAHALKLKVVAEGVETEEQSRLLALLRCDEVQGFLFSKPVPCEVFEAHFLAPTVSAQHA